MGGEMRLMFSVRMPKSAASACTRSAVPSQDEAAAWSALKAVSSITVRRMSVSRRCGVVMSIALDHGGATGAACAAVRRSGRAQTAGRGRQEIVVLSRASGSLPAPDARFEDRRAGGDGDRQAVDLDVDGAGGAEGGVAVATMAGGSGVGGSAATGSGGTVRGHLRA